KQTEDLLLNELNWRVAYFARELLRATKFELQVVLREITASLPHLAKVRTNCGLLITICTTSASDSKAGTEAALSAASVA
ncbi:MAG: hypothetical protein QOJ84_1935, partial [Bradyrhizobium sp.]|nr:hypothetical protein [Bradyrhizobium sp.]